MSRELKLAYIGKECVACGSCAAVCPKDAVSIIAGTLARVDSQKCIGCGRCARICPAAVIEISERRGENEEEMV